MKDLDLGLQQPSVAPRETLRLDNSRPLASPLTETEAGTAGGSDRLEEVLGLPVPDGTGWPQSVSFRGGQAVMSAGGVSPGAEDPAVTRGVLAYLNAVESPKTDTRAQRAHCVVSLILDPSGGGISNSQRQAMADLHLDGRNATRMGPAAHARVLSELAGGGDAYASDCQFFFEYLDQSGRLEEALGLMSMEDREFLQDHLRPHQQIRLAAASP